MRFINKIVIYLIATNFFIEAGFGLIAPVFSVFIIDEVKGGTLAAAGIAAAIYWIAKSIFQIFVGNFLDKKQDEKYDIAFLIIGSILMAGAAFGYLAVEAVEHVYIIQFIAAMGGAFAMPSWYVMFNHHLDRLKEAFEWGLNSSIAYGLGTGVAGGIGGVIAGALGFDAVFIIAGSFSFLGVFVLAPLYRYITKSKEELDHF